MGDGEHVLPAMKALCFDPLLSDPVIQVPGPFVVQIPRPFVWLLHPASRAFAVPLRPPPPSSPPPWRLLLSRPLPPSPLLRSPPTLPSKPWLFPAPALYPRRAHLPLSQPPLTAARRGAAAAGGIGAAGACAVAQGQDLEGAAADAGPAHDYELRPGGAARQLCKFDMFTTMTMMTTTAATMMMTMVMMKVLRTVFLSCWIKVENQQICIEVA